MAVDLPGKPTKRPVELARGKLQLAYSVEKKPARRVTIRFPCFELFLSWP